MVLFHLQDDFLMAIKLFGFSFGKQDIVQQQSPEQPQTPYQNLSRQFAGAQRIEQKIQSDSCYWKHK